MKKILFGTVFLISSVLTHSVYAQRVDVAITNLSNGIYFTPLLVAAHPRSLHLFQAGAHASGALQAMAEGGDLSGLIQELEANYAIYSANPAAGLLAPGMYTMTTLDLEDKKKYALSIVAMLLPTNDGFVGLDAVKIPKHRGSYTFYLNGYDAGTEANDELITGGGAVGVAGIPAAPGGDAGINGAGVTGADSNTRVHIHRGIIGDTDAYAGISDLDSRIHRWLNPVAKVVLTVR